MVKRMLIDATHPEETRVVVMNGTRLEEFDVETSTKRQIKGNVYLAKVVRVEPSLQAAFVDYGGNRHGFLAFSEIHPDYYQIPVADRERLIAAEAEHAQADDHHVADEHVAEAKDVTEVTPAASEATATDDADLVQVEHEDHPVVEHLGGDDTDDAPPSRNREKQPYRQYKIQEVIKRRQILLVQVVKEERGNKGAALTTYLSLAGRYCVLMPNTPRGGGVSRKITNTNDRRRLKEMMSGLEIPEGMAVIVRTAGSERSKAEIKRDYEYLLRTWGGIRTLTMESRAPALVYEEATLIKRSIRDVYSRDIEEVLVEGDEGYRVAKDFMKALTPSHAKKVQPYKDSNLMPLFHRFQVESQLEALHNIQVTLKSGGYIVLNQTEALVAIDVNSGRSTRERNIEETALKTNLEASDEIARQLRLRDLAGLVVIDYIDMEDPKNNAAVERRLKEALRSDRARIQVGRISPFGLMELSRQRLRPSFVENSYVSCPHCKGTGLIRSIESEVVRILRVIEEEGVRRRSAEIVITVPIAAALYILNQKRAKLADIESRYGFAVTVNGSEAMMLGELTLDRTRALTKAESEALMPDITPQHQPVEPEDELDISDEDEDEETTTVETDDTGKDGNKKKRRRRKRRSKKTGEATTTAETGDSAMLDLNENGTVTVSDEEGDEAETVTLTPALAHGETSEPAKKSRRRGRRGGRRRNRTPQTVEGGTVEQVQTILAETSIEDESLTLPQPQEAAVLPVETATPQTPAIVVSDVAAPASEAVNAEGEAPVEATKPPAKPKRTRKPAAKPRKPSSEDQATAEPTEGNEKAEAAPEGGAEAPAKPKRTRKPTAAKAAKAVPAKPAKTDADKVEASSMVIPIVVTEPPAATVMSATETARDPAPASDAPADLPAPEAASASPRKGWWSR